jgi:Glycosyl transferase family 2
VITDTIEDTEGLRARTVGTDPALRGLDDPSTAVRVAVLLPCHNEEASVASVIDAFAAALPSAGIYVCDNGSTDATTARALAAGATVLHEHRLGKGHAVRRMFADVEADVYVLADGDATYDAASAPEMVARLLDGHLDMVVGTRQPDDDPETFRRGHATGNALLTRAFRLCLGGSFTDVLSGYRVMSRRLVKSFPVHADGFDIEAELTAHTVEVDANWLELPTPYGSREEGSASKLRTYRDGARIAISLVRLFEAMYPLRFFLLCFAVLTAVALALGIPVFETFEQTGQVPRLPTAVLAASIQIVAFLSLTCGVVLKSVKLARQEARRLVYLQEGPPRPTGQPTVGRQR